MDCYLGDIYRLYIHDVSSRKARGTVEVGEAEVHKRKRPLQVHGPESEIATGHQKPHGPS